MTDPKAGGEHVAELGKTADNECVEPFDWAWDNFEPTREKLQRVVWEESLQYHSADEP